MDLSSRVTTLNDSKVNTKGRNILYWMQMFKGVSHNYALNFAIQMANEHGLPLVVYEGLKFYYPWANDRLHTFILEGVAEKQAEFSERGIRYIFYLQRNERDPKHTVTQLARDAALLVTDDYPCFIIPEHNERIAQLNRLCTKSSNSICRAPKARNMIARGKRRAQRGASPLDHNHNDDEALKERNNYRRYFALSVLSSI
jgi:deoxyribodipyrimidine photo-lyase